MYTPVGPYSPYIIAEPFVFLSGQIGLNSNGLSGDIKTETAICIDNLNALLSQLNLDLTNIVKTTVFLTDINHYDSMNEIYMEKFVTQRPARSAVVVKELPIGALIEIEAIAKIN